jgi:hypothetical protein
MQVPIHPEWSCGDKRLADYPELWCSSPSRDRDFDEHAKMLVQRLGSIHQFFVGWCMGRRTTDGG